MSGPDVNRDRVTIKEAATLLDVHPNTVRKRVKDGVFDAEQIVTSNGPTWFITRESMANNLANNPLSSGSQEPAVRVQGDDLHKVLTELVKAIEGDPEETQRKEKRENRLEAVKLRTAALRTQVTASAGVIVAFSAIVSFIGNANKPELLYGAIVLLVGSIAFALLYMHALASHTAEDISRPVSKVARAVEFIYYISVLVAMVGTAVFLLLFIYNNGP